MRQNFLRLCALSALLCCQAVPALAAPCVPKSGEPTCRGLECSAAGLGTTVMDSDQQNIIACLSDGAGHIWKSMTSSNANQRSTVTPIAAAACAYVNASANGDSNHSCAIPANATHLKISTHCSAIGIDGSAKIKGAFLPSSEPMPTTLPASLCLAKGSSGETNSNAGYFVVPMPVGVASLEIFIEKEGNVDSRNAKIDILPLLIQ
ncbi:MAG: hypothetical protein PHW63_03070 [Alphaproteobacteria bacterium]|nr:hypothetical protein [Alphaproteobacteria bacterium]